MNDSETAQSVLRIDADRRNFFARLTLGLSAAIGAMMTLPVVGFVLGPILRHPKRVWQKVDDALVPTIVGQTVLVTIEDASPLPWSGVTAETGAWLRKVGEDQFIAFSINCRHLGCPVRWVEAAELFMCPCHGGVYYADGEVAAGPPPQPLARYPVRVEKGRVEIETSAIPLPGEE